jgi:hypothetical protein
MLHSVFRHKKIKMWHRTYLHQSQPPTRTLNIPS